MTPLLYRVARRQGGAFTRRQAMQCGMTPGDIERRLLDGDWILLMADVLASATTPITDELKAWTGVLAIGHPVALAGRFAGRRLGLEQVPAPPLPQLVVPKDRRYRHLQGLDVRRANDWQTTWCNGLPVAPVELTIRQIAAEVRHEVLRDIVQHALRRRRTTLSALQTTLGRGLSGSAALRSALEEVAPGYQVKWEGVLHRAVHRAGLPLQPQVPVRNPLGIVVAYLDLGDPVIRFGVEVDGFVNHMARFSADRQRARRLAFECGWRVAVYAVEEIVERLDDVVAEIVGYAEQLRRAQPAAS